MKKSLTTLTENLPALAKSSQTLELDWLDKVGNILRDVRLLVNEYKVQTGQLNPDGENAEIMLSDNTKPDALVEILNYLIQILDMAEKQGHGDKPVSDIINSLNIPVKQAKQLLQAAKVKRNIGG